VSLTWNDCRLRPYSRPSTANRGGGGKPSSFKASASTKKVSGSSTLAAAAASRLLTGLEMRFTVGVSSSWCMTRSGRSTVPS
jgi:hypothetical protein